jgi:L-ascorbate metabolism protein UlaG (beta-lactamase superfamily)
MLELTWLGHAAFLAGDGKSKVIFDPFLTGNPRAAAKAGEIDVDAILVTHAHDDHLGDTIEIAKRCKALVVGSSELVAHCTARGAAGHAMHIGGRHAFPFGEVKLTPAIHGFSKEFPGVPCGFILNMGGVTLYHAGDTALFSDMQLIAESDPIDVALLPIGDNYTMGIDDALRAVRLLAPRHVVPMHYNTWPVITVDVRRFIDGVAGGAGTIPVLMEPGQTKRFE